MLLFVLIKYAYYIVVMKWLNTFSLFSPGPPEFTEELHTRQETDGVLLESYLIYEPEHQATWFKEDKPLLGALDFDEKYQV